MRPEMHGLDLECEIRELRLWMSDEDIGIVLGRDAGMFSSHIGGATLAEIGERHGMTRQAVSLRFKLADLPIRRRAYHERRLAELVRRLGSRVRGHWLAGLSIEEIAAEVRIPAHVAREIVDVVKGGEDDGARRRRRWRAICAERARDGGVTSAQQRIERAVVHLLEAERLNGGPPTRKRYIELASEHPDLLPPLDVVTACYDTYRELQVAAGHLPPWTLRRDRITTATCWEGLHTVAAELGEPGHPPNSNQYRRISTGRSDLPSYALIARRIGSWSKVYQDWPGPQEDDPDEQWQPPGEPSQPPE